MELYKIKIFESLIIIVIYIAHFFLIKKLINLRLKKLNLHVGRRKFIIKVLITSSTIIAFILIASVWGLEQHEILAYVGTVLTVLGIAFFAQWSLLSNITSSVILFFNHPMKIGDTIKIHDKESPIEGEIHELSYFFVHIKISENEIVTIPNSLLLQKSISVIYL